MNKTIIFVAKGEFMRDNLENVIFYQKACKLWDDMWNDTDLMMNDIRGIEIVKQITRSVGSISANIEEGYGRGYGKEYPRYLKISRGSAKESKGWYKRSGRLLNKETIDSRIKELDSIIAMLSKSIETLDLKAKAKPVGK